MTRPPLTVNVWRGDTIESRHLVHGAVMDKDGKILESWGDIDQPVYPRSCLKSLQAILLLESGAHEHFGLGDEEIALACASHNAEDVHLEKIDAWLHKIGLTQDNLECGGHDPILKDRADELLRKNIALKAIHSDCSGKHAGMLSTAMHQGHDPKGYTKRDHPVQQQIFQILSEMTDHDVTNGAWGIDGCSVPNPAIPIKNLALGFARFITPANLPSKRADACLRIQEAVAKNPLLIAGSKRLDTKLIEASQGNIFCKVGAEGNYLAIARKEGIVAYFKAGDGAIRAVHAASGAVLNKFNLIDKKTDKAIAEFTRPTLKNWAGLEIGKITVERI